MSRFRGNWDTGQRRNLRRVVVVGAGRAGVSAAEELRRQGFGGEIVVLCDEAEAPYDRPSCSKGLLTGHKRPRDARMPVQDDLAIQWEMGRRAARLDPERRVVVADTDEEYKYDGLVIASGARPVWPKGWPEGAPGLHALHGLNDAWGLRQALRRARRVAVVGGGLTGCEVASAVRSMARECVLIDSKQQVMSRALGEVVGRYVTEVVAQDGVELRLGRRFSRLDRHRRGWVLVLDDGSEVVADVVVATIGERPNTGWLEASGFDISDGVLCDENLRVVGGEDVVACGTVARWPNLRYSATPRRVGQWIMALEQGRAAAAALLRSDHPTRPATLVPRFWSEQFGLRIQVCGEVPLDGSAEVTVERKRPGRRDPAKAGVLVGYHRDGEQVGVVAVNSVRAFTTIARTILAAEPKLAEPPALFTPAELVAAPPRRAVPGHLMIDAVPAPPVSSAPRAAVAGARPVSTPRRSRSTIEVPASAVRELAYSPSHSAVSRERVSGRHAARDESPIGHHAGSGYVGREHAESGYAVPGYPRPGYEPYGGRPNGYEPRTYAGLGHEPVGRGGSSYEPPASYGQPGYDVPGYGQPTHPPILPADYEPAPVQPVEQPVSPPAPRRLNPRDRFATGQFATVR